MDVPRRSGTDAVFFVALGTLGGLYIVLIVAMLVADASYTSPGHLWAALASPQIQFAIRLSLLTSTLSALFSLAVGIPLGYLLARTEFAGKRWVDAAVDIPIVLPPLVIGLSLLILTQRPAEAAVYGMVPFVAGAVAFALLKGRVIVPAWFALLAGGVALFALWITGLGSGATAAVRGLLGPPAAALPYTKASVIVAQFAVAAAFAVRTMRVTFEQISPRSEEVAMTLGCGRAEAFLRVTLPEARRGILTALTVAWARSLGEFGPVLIFSGATRLKTEVLSTTVFLELSIGNLEAAVAVSLLMVIAAIFVLVVVRVLGTEVSFVRTVRP